jgi:hypothetical protein
MPCEAMALSTKSEIDADIRQLMGDVVVGNWKGKQLPPDAAVEFI